MATKKASKKALKKAPAKKATAKKSTTKTKKKSAPKPTNIERLTAAGVILPENVADHDHKVINKKLSAAEVNTLIKLRKKMGAAPLAVPGSRPNFPV